MTDTEEAFQSADDGDSASESTGTVKGSLTPEAGGESPKAPSSPRSTKKKSKKQRKRKSLPQESPPKAPERGELLKDEKKSQKGADNEANKILTDVEPKEDVKLPQVEEQQTTGKMQTLTITDDVSQPAAGRDPEKVNPFEVVKQQTVDNLAEIKDLLQDGKATTGTYAEPVVTSQPEDEFIDRGVEYDKEARTHEALEKLAEAADAHSSWSFSTWGSNVLTAAGTSVSTFTHTVGEGLSSVLDAVDNTLGAPDPEELVDSGTSEQTVNVLKEEAPKDGENKPDEGQNAQGAPVEASSKSSWYSAWGLGSVLNTVQQSASLVQEKGRVLMTGGLDALETLGKHTYHILAEGEHGLKKAISLNRKDTVLSEVLREAKQVTEIQAKEEEEFKETRKTHFGYQFDEFQGLVKLEALEMLSNECEGRLHMMLGSMGREEQEHFKQQLVAIKECFEIEEDDQDQPLDPEVLGITSFKQVVDEVTVEMDVDSKPAKLLEVQEKLYNLSCEELPQSDDVTALMKVVAERCVQSLAELTAASVQHYLQLAQLIKLHSGAETTAELHVLRATYLRRLMRALCNQVTVLSEAYIQHVLQKVPDDSERTKLVTNIYVEATNSSTYIQDAFQLLLPVIQQTVLEPSS